MPFRPPKGVRPPQLEGKRTGRPKGSRNYATALREMKWGYDYAYDETAKPPTAGAGLWKRFAEEYFEEVEEFLDEFRML